MPQILNNRYGLKENPVAGGMSEVYKGFDLLTDRAVAVKLFKPGNFRDEILDESFKRETQALQELKHPHIVELIDSGQDERTGRHFIVLEWMHSNLSDWLLEHSVDGWDDFYERYASAILQGLSFAHERHVVHRDIKPKNILMTADGVPKIADFGIAAFKRYVEPGVTLADFVSRPFTPPELDDGTRSFSRDVYSFGVLVLACVTEERLEDYEHIDNALNALDAPEEVFRLIQKCVSREAAKRPLHAGLLLNDLEKVWQRRQAEWEPSRVCYVRLSPAARGTLLADLGIVDSVFKGALLDDLSISGMNVVKPVHQNQTDKVRYEIYAQSYLYTAVVESRDGDHLFITRAIRLSSGKLEKLREESWRPSNKFTFRYYPPTDLALARDAISFMEVAVDETRQQLDRKRQARDEQKLLNVWEATLRAKTDFERNRNGPIHYGSFRRDGSRVLFRLTNDPPEDIVGQSRIVKLPDSALVRGEVDGVRGKDLSLYISDGDINLLPHSGRLEFDSFAADVALNRQKEALDAVRFGRAVDPRLKELIIHPSKASAPHTDVQVNFLTPELDEAKVIAVTKALGLRDLLVVEGPPGTGKTTFIAETVVQMHRQDPELRILISSQTHVALDNAIERISRLSPDLQLIRIAGPAASARVADAVRPHLVNNQMEVWRKNAIESGKTFLEGMASSCGISAADLRTGLLLKDLNISKKRLQLELEDNTRIRAELEEVSNSSVDLAATSEETTRQFMEELKSDLSRSKERLNSIRKEIKLTEEKLRALTDYGDELVALPPEELDEWARTVFLPQHEGTRQLLDLLNVHADWEDQFGRREEFEAALLSTAEVIAGTCLGVAGVRRYQDVSYDVCIVDEASKATPTEVMVPLSRSKKWILVGDQRQLSPFQSPELNNSGLLAKYDLRPEDLKETLFDHLMRNLPEDCRTTLTEQHRMVAPIGNLISDCFYDGVLRNNGPAIDESLGSVFPKAVSWFTTAALEDRYELKVGNSFVNHREASFLVRLLERINGVAGWNNRHFSVAVIAGYASQRKEIERKLAGHLDTWTNLNVDCNTVDAFQGREAEIVLYSVTRSNPNHSIGFLREKERLNVALSRGRFYLGIVGDHSFCKSVTGENPFRSVIEHIEIRPEGCVITEAAE